MVDERDFRVTMDLCLPPNAASRAEEIRDALTPFIRYGVVIKEGTQAEERGFIEVIRCGHRIGEACEKLARWEVGRGKVI